MSQVLTDAFALLQEAQRKNTSVDVTLDRAVRLIGLLVEHASHYERCFRTEVQKLSLTKGDVLIVKLGDPTSGHIPGPQVGEEALDLIRKALADAGVTDVPAVLILRARPLDDVAGDARRLGTPRPRHHGAMTDVKGYAFGERVVYVLPNCARIETAHGPVRVNYGGVLPTFDLKFDDDGHLLEVNVANEGPARMWTLVLPSGDVIKPDPDNARGLRWHRKLDGILSSFAEEAPLLLPDPSSATP